MDRRVEGLKERFSGESGRAVPWLVLTSRRSSNPMPLNSLPLSYCTNVHPGRSLAEVQSGLENYAVPVRQNYGGPLAAGLWLARPVARELLHSADALPRFAGGLTERGLTCYTLNAFPYGDFHSDRVKENVYLPDWTDIERLEYTYDCATILAALLPEGVEGSISTVPLGFKEFAPGDDFVEACIGNLIALARQLDQLADDTGKIIRLAIEPEPVCLLETAGETLAFFERLWDRAEEGRAVETVRQHLGVCYDVCHQAVEFEDIPASIAELTHRGVRINKVHITCALQLDDPATNEEGRRELARYAEPRYLHQTFARTRGGQVLHAVDLTEQLALHPAKSFREADMWRIHFHVPVDADSLGPLRTTRPELRRALGAIAGLDEPPHLEVETYTWRVLPGGESVDLVEGLTRELVATRALLEELGTADAL